MSRYSDMGEKTDSEILSLIGEAGTWECEDIVWLSLCKHIHFRT